MTTSLRHLLPAALTLAALATTATGAHAQVFDLRDYFETQSLAQPQTPGELWTVHYGDRSGALLPLLSSTGVVAYGYGCADGCTQLGAPVNAGDPYWHNGHGVPMLPSFDGLFLHPGSSAAASTSIVFNAQADTWLSGVTVMAEFVYNGISSNGVDITVNHRRGSITTHLGSYVVSGTDRFVNPFSFGASPLWFAAGDSIEVDVGPNGSYFYDHLNIDVQTTAVQAASVPEPGSWALMLAGVGGLLWRRRAHAACCAPT